MKNSDPVVEEPVQDPEPHPGTGLPGLDEILGGIEQGDNIVWQMDSLDDLAPYLEAFSTQARLSGTHLTYFRFAKHRALLDEAPGVEIIPCYPEEGFERFITLIHDVIQRQGKGGYYLFDSLSKLALDGFSERMTGNFFMLTCPLLRSVGSLAYFPMLRNYNSHHAAAPIAKTTQLLLDIYTCGEERYVHPLKVENKYSSSMYMLHVWTGDQFHPVVESPIISSVSRSGPWYGLQSASYRMVGMWDRRFMQAEEALELYERGAIKLEELDATFLRQLKQLFSRDEAILDIARRYLTLSDLIALWKRTIGSGMIGGKSIGMLLGRAILRKEAPALHDKLEVHDSFFIGSDVFYSFLVENDCWDLRRAQKDTDTFANGAEEIRTHIHKGVFPDYVMRRFMDMLDYFGQSPIVVRSSSLLEDNFGNAFAGKYESVFCTNCGTREQRLAEFIDAVRTVYASTMSVEALHYRARRNLLDLDEQMALLVQRVSGTRYEDYFFPHLAGVAVSYNSYAWDDAICPEAGLLRIVVGLGTRAVDRCDDDYTRIAALNVPMKRPEGNQDEILQHTQRRVDVIDLQNNCFATKYFMDLVNQCPGLPLDLLSDVAGGPRARAAKRPAHRFITFDRVFKDTAFIADMRELLQILQRAYGCPVETEFAVNVLNDGSYRINLLQCRPLQVRKNESISDEVPELDVDRTILRSRGGVIGQSRILAVDRIVYVVPSVYGYLSERDRYAVARAVGGITSLQSECVDACTMLLGPGRWGTTMPSLGVPVSFHELSSVAVLCEIAAMNENLTPDLSLGTHFFNEIVESDLLYLAFYPDREGNILHEERLMAAPNGLSTLVPEAAALENVIRVISADDLGGEQKLYLHADALRQTYALYIQ